MRAAVPLLPLLLALPAAAAAWEDPRPALSPLDVFELEYASDPRFSPDGGRVAYVRNSFDIRTDARVARIWLIDLEDGSHRPLNDGDEGESSPRWSPDGTRIAYLSGGQIRVKHLDRGRQTVTVTRALESPRNLAWSPDGALIAFTMHVPEAEKGWANLPVPPEGAEWAEPATVIDRLLYRIDGAGYVEGGYRHLFVVPAEGGTARALTEGRFHHDGVPVWSPDGATIYIEANRDPDWEHEPEDTEIHAISVESGEIRAVTDRFGPDGSPAISPAGDRLVWVGHDDRRNGYEVDRLSIAGPDGKEGLLLTGSLDRSVESPRFSPDGETVFFQFDDQGDTKIAAVPRGGGEVRVVAGNVGGSTIGRPYGAGSFDVGPGGRLVYTRTTPASPAELALLLPGAEEPTILTGLNSDILPHRTLGRVEEIRVPSRHDGREIQAWIIHPPGFDPEREYPLLLEIHGGPFANYGARFSAELQLYAAAGNIVLYANPRGSTGYGQEFGNLIHHAYPGHDYDDLMSCVDAAIARGSVDTSHLFVTGGSGGGVLTAWIVGKTERFRAAVVAKPVIHWTSFVLTADHSSYFTKYWFPGPPWEHPEHYFARSPLSLVGKVTTPTMLITGEDDYRTPISETEQYYQALKLRRIDTAMVRIPGASHGIGARPSNLLRQVAYTLGWFERHSEMP